MKYSIPALVACATLASPLASADIELLGKAVILYGKLHASADFYDRGSETATIPEPTGIEITSNSSRFGLKGEKDLASFLKGVWKFESEYDISGETGTLAARNRYVGASGPWGMLLLGIHDTPFKEMLGYTLFSDTVGDPRAVFGQVSSNDNQFNQRARSMARYQIQVAGLNGAILYSPDFEDANDPDTSTSSQKNRLFSAGLGYRIGGFRIGAAYELQENIDNTAGKDASGIRIGAKYTLAGFELGGLIERLENDGYGVRMARNAYGVNLSYTVSNVTVSGQYLKAMDSDLPAGNDGATQFALGVSYTFNKDLQVYLAHAMLRNDVNASFQLARSGHGQSYSPTQAGERVSASSIGLVYNF